MGPLTPKFVAFGSIARQFGNWLDQEFAELPLGGQSLEVKTMFPLRRVTSLCGAIRVPIWRRENAVTQFEKMAQIVFALWCSINSTWRNTLLWTLITDDARKLSMDKTHSFRPFFSSFSIHKFRVSPTTRNSTFYIFLFLCKFAFCLVIA